MIERRDSLKDRWLRSVFAGYHRPMSRLVLLVFAVVVLVPFSAIADNLYLYSLTFSPRGAGNGPRAALYDEATVLTSVQGIVNRNAPTLYLLFTQNTDAPGPNIDQLWLDRMMNPAIGGTLVAGRPRIVIDTPLDLVRTFRGSVRGAVVWDPRVAATANAAFVAAGAEDLVVVRYDPTPTSMYSQLVTSGLLPVVRSFVRRDGTSLFIDNAGNTMIPDTARPSTQSAKADAYLWTLEHYLRPGMLNAKEFGYYLDGYWIERAGDADLRHSNVTNRDYLVARRGFTLDLSMWEDEAPNDAPTQPLGVDTRTLREILTVARGQAGTDPIAMHGFLSWQFKYAVGRHMPVESEWQLARTISPFLVYLDADAPGPSAMANASFFMHLAPPVAPPAQSRPTPEQLVGEGHLRGLIADSSFEEGGTGWTFATTNHVVYANYRGAHSGRRFLECNTASLVGDREDSIYFDAAGASAGSDVTLRVFVRSPTATPIRGDLVIWGLGGATEQSVQSFVTAGSGWQAVTATLRTTTAHATLRAQLYLRTTNQNLDVDDVAFFVGDAASLPVAPETFVLFYMGDWDSAAWMYTLGTLYWDGPGRGQVPLAWGFNPNLADRISPFFHHVLATRSPRDWFVCGESGPGYLNPSFLDAPLRAGWARFGARTLGRLEESIVGWILNPTAALSAPHLEPFAVFGGDGMIVQAQSVDFALPGLVHNTPVGEMNGDLDRDSVANSVQRVLNSTPASASAPTFRSYRAVLVTGQFATDVAAGVDDRRPASRVRVVDPYTYMSLMRAHFGQANDYRASYLNVRFASEVLPGEMLRISLAVRNDGWLPWISNAPNIYNVGAHVAQSIEPQSLPINPSAYPVRVAVGPRLNPGETRDITLDVRAPLSPGVYEVQIDTVREGVSWFESRRDNPLRFSITVRGQVLDAGVGDGGDVSMPSADAFVDGPPGDGTAFDATAADGMGERDVFADVRSERPSGGSEQSCACRTHGAQPLRFGPYWLLLATVALVKRTRRTN